MQESRKIALEIGDKYYFNGKACARGGISKRLSSTGYCQCDLCIKAKNESNKNTMKKAYAKDPSKIKGNSKKYYSENKTTIFD